jgi:hypothetical protein
MDIMRSIKCSLLLFILPIVLFSQINFELDFSIPKINPNDELIDFTTSNNQNIIAGFNNTEGNCFRIARYDSNGNLISSYDNNYSGNEELSCIYSDSENNNPYIYLGFKEDLTIKLNIISLDDYSLIDSVSYIFDISGPPGYYSETNVSISSIKILETNDSYNLFIGVVEELYWDNGAGFGYEETDHKWSDLLIFNKINNEYEFIEKLSNNGLAIFSSDIIISSGFEEYHYLYHEPPIMIDIDEYDLCFYIQGTNYIPDNLVFHEFGDDYVMNPDLQILTFEDLSYYNYGTIIYHNSSNSPTFINLSPDFSTIQWENNNTNFEYFFHITSFTNIETNFGDHFLMYFSNNEVEIRNRINGNIVHYESGMIDPISILTFNNESKLFVTEDQELFHFYSIEDTIYVSSMDCINSKNRFNVSNYPNPFNPETTISFTIQNSNKVTLDVYNIKGQKIKTLLNDQINRGKHSIVWNGVDKNNNPVSSGVYLYSLKTRDQQITKRMLLLK